MSEEIKKTPEQLIAEKDLAKAEELKVYIGKSFKKKDGTKGTAKIVAYGGIHVRAIKDLAERFHTFVVEIPGSARWTPSAKKFLEEWEEVQVEPNKTILTEAN